MEHMDAGDLADRLLSGDFGPTVIEEVLGEAVLGERWSTVKFARHARRWIIGERDILEEVIDGLIEASDEELRGMSQESRMGVTIAAMVAAIKEEPAKLVSTLALIPILIERLVTLDPEARTLARNLSTAQRTQDGDRS
jgi:hypothetical protein